MSAVSEHKDLDLVDLRNQLEKPIFESLLLMSTYAVYMSQYVLQHLGAPPPFSASAELLHYRLLWYEDSPCDTP